MDPSEPIADATSSNPLVDYLDQLVADLRKLTPSALAGADVESVHDARVATRRLKAALDLLGPILGERCKKPFSKVTRDLRRRLGPLRDLDVMIEHLSGFEKLAMDAAVAWLAHRFKNCRQQALAQSGKVDSVDRALSKLSAWWGVRQNILDARDQIPQLINQAVSDRLDVFSRQADALSEHLLQKSNRIVEPTDRATGSAAEIELAQQPVVPDPHELRIAGKALRYTLELARESGVDLAPSLMREFKNIQEHLGIWHDYIVLTERMLRETVESDLPLHNPQLQAQLLKLAQLTLRKAQTELNKMGTLWRRRGNKLAGQIRDYFQIVAPDEDQLPELAKSILPERHGSIVAGGER